MDRALLLSALIAGVKAQQACTTTAETHPSLTWQECTEAGCTDVDGSIVVDSNWRWTHTVDGSTNCYTGNEWDTDICTDGETCAEECCVDGADYEGTYGIATSDTSLTLTFVTEGSYSTNIGSRVYLMESDDSYQMFDLLGNEFTFDVDVSNLGCGLNGALYFVSMDQDGGLATYDGNNAGAGYGTGYCDSQCPRDIKFIGGVANVDDWTPSTNDDNAGVGNLGACCSEMDVWEANSISNAFTPHPCSTLGFFTCEGDDCGGTYSEDRYAGDCDPDGCDFNPFRQGNETFYGPGSDYMVDSSSVVTVVTQFLADDSGNLSEIKRYYVQNDVVIANSASVVPDSGNSITDDFCTAQKTAFGDDDVFSEKGGMIQMGADMSAMVLVMSLWDDHYANMLWLDSTYPVDSTSDGAYRGTCDTSSGVPSDVESDQADATVVFSNIKFGPVGTTFDSTAISDDSESDVSSSTAQGATTSTSASAVSSSVASSSTVVASSSTTVAASLSTSTTASSSSSTPTTVAAPLSSTPSTSAVATEPAISSAASAATTSGTSLGTSTNIASPATTSSSSGGSGSSGAALYNQCGGTGWTGATTCADGCCQMWNDYYYQCISTCDNDASGSASASSIDSSSGSSESTIADDGDDDECEAEDP
ncbi:hypothetical protein MKZ38_009093 [Zalerion maritima]|uniref:Glucanase n=1 Tax=Zalerion maritima TaxID=339359 RepID=A0AAD5RV54_9PEZI|nr:hypothetical protein MKZ38_009093 [Zalerion maritima]